MTKQLQIRRVLLLLTLLGVAYAGLGYRLVDLQVLRHTELEAKAQEYTVKQILRPPRRGDIVDSRGNVLATSVFVKTVCANPSVLGNHQALVARTIAPILKLNEAEVYQKLQPRITLNPSTGLHVTNRYVRLREKVAPETWLQISNAMSQLKFVPDESRLTKSQQAFYRDLRKTGVFTELMDDQLRVYPNQELAAHVLGFVGKNLNDTNNVPGNETIGRAGIEQTMEDKLAGRAGWRVMGVDNRRREVVAHRTQDVEPRDGFKVVLTIDSVLQHILETELAKGKEKHSPTSITGVIIQPRTGKVLAMATLPTFDPNSVGKINDTHRNRVISERMEPGSTFKIVTVSGALNEGIVKMTDVIDCERGKFAFAGRTLHDAHGGHGLLTVANIISKSSNIGSAKIGIKLTEARLYDYMKRYGFGEVTGIPLPYEQAGTVARVDKWSKVSIAQIPMGHGVDVTRLQMVMAMAALANEGMLMKPMLVEKLEGSDGQTIAQYKPEPLRQVVSEATARQMIAALKSAVSTNGTAEKAVVGGYDVAGKTGTAQKIERGTYSQDKFISSFIGFFPADNPELCISIVLDEPKGQYYGGLTAAPVFHEVAERAANYLNIKPDGKAAEMANAPGGPIESTDTRTTRVVAQRTTSNP